MNMYYVRYMGIGIQIHMNRVLLEDFKIISHLWKYAQFGKGGVSLEQQYNHSITQKGLQR